VALYVLISVVVAGEAIDKDPQLGIFLFGGFGVLGVTMPALFTIGGSLAMEREMGLMRLKRAQPAPTASWLVAKIACGLAFSTIAYLPMLAVALAAGKLPLETGQVLAMSAALIAGSIPFCALGLMIGTLVTGSAAPGYANLIYLPGCYLSGLFFPLPASMHWQTPIWPQFHINQLAMHAAGAAKFQFLPVQFAVAGLVGFTVLFSAVAIWRLARKG
jgi:ABC-2 type transport system permease protein